MDHALVMDTDDMPGRGGYGVVGLSPGVTPAERLFVAENFGISDYLHDPKNDRQLFSVFRVPGGRRALVRRFGNGTRRNGTQNRVFVHTLFLDDAVDDAVHGLPWLLADASFRLPGGKLHSLTRDRGPLLSDPEFPPLEWNEEAELTAPPVQRFAGRMKRVEGWLAQAGLGNVTAVDAVAAILAGLRTAPRVVLPQGTLYEQLTLLAWSMLPLGDRETLAWTQHDSGNTVVPFAVANATQPATVDLARGATGDARWIVSMNTESVESWREFHDKTARCHLTVRGGDIGAWRKWRAALLGVVEKVNAVDVEIESKLTALARSASVDPKVQEPWVDGVEVLQLLWTNIRRAIAAGEPAETAVRRWGSRLHDTGLDRVIFRVPPAAAWLDATANEIGAPLLVEFFLFGTHDEAGGVATRAAIARWLLAARRSRRVTVGGDVLARLAGSVMSDESGVVEPLLDWLLDDPNGLASLEARVRQLPGYGNFVLLATVIALRKQHPQTAAYVHNALLPQVEKSEETRGRVNDVIADAVAGMLRDEPQAFVRFASRLGERTAARLTAFVVTWLEQDRARTLPLAREIVGLASENRYPAVAATATLAMALAEIAEAADVWFRVLLRTAKKLDAGSDPAAVSQFVAEVSAIRSVSSRGTSVVEPLIDHLNAGAEAQARVGRCVRALILMTRPVWTPRLASAVAGVLAYTSRTAEWDGVVAALAEEYGGGASPVLRRFWERVDSSEIPNVSEAVIDATTVIDGRERDQLLELWLTRIRRVPAGARCERFLDALAQAAGGVSRGMRIPLAWRELELRIATEETLNELDEDLWARDRQRYESDMSEALKLWSGREGDGALARATSLLHLLASPHVLPSVKFVCEGTLADLLAALTPPEWTALMRVPPETLFARPMAALLLARQLGASGAEEAALVFESACRRQRRTDASDCLLLGRHDRKPWRRFQRALGMGSPKR
ncbi:MAG TPA: hypothetical protein VEK57_22450 [Thermoanaerobaculia bacterium]|nr:hypothetical protein [Thermoanaerobaculia bacterium]